MNKQQTHNQFDSQIIYRKNRGRLMQQNRQLYSQIIKLENKVSAVLTKNISNDFKQKVQEQNFMSRHRQQTKDQISEIKRLKKKILLLKNGEKPQQKQDIREGLDQIAFLKKQKMKLINQKEALIKKRKIKQFPLQLNKPLQKQNKRMLGMYRQIQHENNEYRSKILKVERQVKYFHKIKQLSKTSAPKIVQNNEFEIIRIQHQIQKLKKQIKEIQKQWQPRVQSLNTQYFILKDIKRQKQEEIQKSDKLIQSYTNRISGMRQEQKIFQDRARIKDVVISVQKRQQIRDKFEAQKERREFFQQFNSSKSKEELASSRLRNKNKEKDIQKERDQKISKQKYRNNKSKQKNQKSSKTMFLAKSHSRQQLSNQKIPLDKLNSKEHLLNTNLFNSDHITTKPELFSNQLSFSPKKSQIHKLQSSKQSPNKSFTSVAVGTTFYYNEDQN